MPDESIGTVVLAPTEECAAGVREALSLRNSGLAAWQVEVAAGPEAGAAVAAARKRFGGVPLGFVAVDEVEALMALETGADEVMVWQGSDPGAVRGFFDRTLLRAGLRKEQEERSAALAHSEKLTALGTLVAGVAHEINNPLTALQLSLQAFSTMVEPLNGAASQIREWAKLQRGASPGQLEMLRDHLRRGGRERDGKDLLTEMLTATGAIGDVVKDLRIFARSDCAKEEAQVVNAHDVIDQALRLIGREIEAVGQTERDFCPDLPRLVVPRGRISQVLVNVLMNAAQALQEVERRDHRVRISTRCDDEQVAISISDTGLGIPPEAVPHIFDPFFTTKRAGLGTGLGLSISRSMMQDMGGDLLVDSVHGSGATFIVLIPLPDYDDLRLAYSRSIPKQLVPSSIRRSTVLLVDDDERVLRAYSRLLGKHYNVLLASSSQEAKDLLLSGSDVRSVVMELGLSESEGPAFYSWLRGHDLELATRVIFVAEDTSMSRHREFLDAVAVAVLQKPFGATALQERLRALEAEVCAASEEPVPYSGSRPTRWATS